jgi:hypothetical protein
VELASRCPGRGEVGRALRQLRWRDVEARVRGRNALTAVVQRTRTMAMRPARALPGADRHQ